MKAILSPSAWFGHSMAEEPVSRPRQRPKGLALTPALAMLVHQGRRRGPSPR